MVNPSPTRQRLIQAALDLFLVQGVSQTTTRQIAETAAVNEVTLFRQFGNKQGLLLAVLEESTTVAQLSDYLLAAVEPVGPMPQVLRQYASVYLHALEQAPQLLRSLIGDAGQSSPASQLALGHVMATVNQSVAQYLETALQAQGLVSQVSPETLAALLHSLLLGAVLIDSTSDAHQLWGDQATLLDQAVTLMLAIVDTNDDTSALAVRDPLTLATPAVQDLSAPRVHQILGQAKKVGLRDYALAYVLFAAGVSPHEIVTLTRADQISDSRQHSLQLQATDTVRQVPVNQWIMGKRYGSYTANPLTKWLKSRKDKQPQLFLNAMDQPITAPDITLQWQQWTTALFSIDEPCDVHQAQHTWIIDMLLRGMRLDNLSLLTGQDQTVLQPYVERAQRIAALDQAARLDQKPGHALLSADTVIGS